MSFTAMLYLLFKNIAQCKVHITLILYLLSVTKKKYIYTEEKHINIYFPFYKINLLNIFDIPI